jgi:hypothetical protein
MRKRIAGAVAGPRRCVVGVLVLAASLQGQQSRGQQPQSAQPAAPQAQGQSALLEIYQIDLEPTGATFALGEPKLEGSVYVYSAWPERAIVRLPLARVRKITRRTRDLSKETVYLIDLVPSGRMITREKPKLQTGSYVFRSFKNETLMSVRQKDVKKITLLTGLPAFRVQQEELGAALIGNLPMEGGSAQAPSAPGAAAAPGQAPAPGNWTYEGKPGVTDAYAPGNATVARPGDVPKAPAPAPAQPPH